MAMGRPLTADTLARMRVLLFDHELNAPLVARRLGLGERIVQIYRRRWAAEAALILQDAQAVATLADVPDDR